MIGTMFALVGSLCSALVFVTIRKLPKTPSSVCIFHFSLFSFVAGGAALLILQEFKIPSSLRVWLLLIGINLLLFIFSYKIHSLFLIVNASSDSITANGICGTCGQLLLTVSLKIENAGPVSLARTMDIVMAFVYQVLILNQPAEVTSLIGAFIICFGVLLLAVHKWYQQNPAIFNSILPFQKSNSALKVQDCKPNTTNLASISDKSEDINV